MIVPEDRERYIRDRINNLKNNLGDWFGSEDATEQGDVDAEYLLGVIDRLRKEDIILKQRKEQL